MKLFMKISIFFVLTFIILISCSDNTNKERFISAYKDILILRLMYPDTTIANPKIKKRLEGYGYTKASFSQKFEEYGSNGDEFRKMIDTARARAKRDYIKFRKMAPGEE